jgi:hypothetical protein
MVSADDGGGPSRPGLLNYFNYFTEVEEEFVRRRGKPLLVSPMDWALIESWKNTGIPLHVVLRAINQAFDAYESRARRHRKVNSIFYCQQEVEATFAQYRLAQVGAPPEPADEHGPPAQPEARGKADRQAAAVFPKSILLDFFSRSDGELAAALTQAEQAGQTDVADALRRARARLEEITREVEHASRADTEAIERDLDGIDRVILDALAALAGQRGIERIRSEAESQLRPYRKKMDRAVYDQTVKNFIARRLRESHSVPRLSLFYI